jgi:hypothetical protein
MSVVVIECLRAKWGELDLQHGVVRVCMHKFLFFFPMHTVSWMHRWASGLLADEFLPLDRLGGGGVASLRIAVRLVGVLVVLPVTLGPGGMYV